MAIKDLLKGCPLFFELYDEEIEKVVKNQKVTHFEQGEKIVREGQRANQIFILLEGIAELEKQAEGGRIRIERIKQGEVFGLLMLLDEKPYSIDVVARTRCAVLEIHHASIMALFDKNPRIFAVMTLNICRILGRRLRGSYNKMAQLKVSSEVSLLSPHVANESDNEQMSSAIDLMDETDRDEDEREAS